MGVDCGTGHRGAVRPAPPLSIERVARWGPAAEVGLRDALGAYASDIREGVASGRMELWRIDGDSWAVMEARAGTLICWCYQGRNVRRFAAVGFSIARRNALDTFEFSTPHRALGRMVRGLGFELVAVDDGNLHRYQAVVE